MAQKEEEMFMEKVFNGDYNGAEYLIRNGININYESPTGITPLHLAMARNDCRMAKLLLDQGADCNHRSLIHFSPIIMRKPLYFLAWEFLNMFEEVTPLKITARYGQASMVQLLIKHGANINLRDQTDESALYTALYFNSPMCADILIGNGAEVLPNDVNAALTHCPGFDIQKLITPCVKSTTILRALHLAVWDEDCERLRDLLKTGYDVNVQDNCGKTALHIALENEYLDCAELLLQKGVNVNALDKYKITPLHTAASKGLSKIMPLLIDNGALVNAKCYCDFTPLHFAVSNGIPMSVKVLLSYGACVNTKSIHDKTALHMAIPNSLDCIPLLMKENADIFAKDVMGICPLDSAIDCAS